VTIPEEELKVLFGEARKKVKKAKGSSNSEMLKQVQHDGGWGVKYAVIVPGVASLMLVVAVSGAYFSDIEESLGNVFGAADSFDNTAQTLVINEFLWNSTCTPNPETKFFLELYNGFDVQINLKDWRFLDGNGNIVQISNSNKHHY